MVFSAKAISRASQPPLPRVPARAGGGAAQDPGVPARAAGFCSRRRFLFLSCGAGSFRAAPFSGGGDACLAGAGRPEAAAVPDVC